MVKQFVIDYTRETQDPLMEHEVNGLDYRYVYGNERLSVNISPIENGAGHVVESGTVGQQIRLYYHQDLRGTVDYLTSPVSQKVESWIHYNEWGEITHNAVLKCGQRELDLVKNDSGHDFDAVLNLYYAKARRYDAENRRFVSIDPILDGTKYDLSEYTTEAITFSAYLYVQNNPLRWVDPLGEAIIPYPGFIHQSVLLHIKMNHPDYYLEQTIDYAGTWMRGRADVISPDGQVWEVKSKGAIGTPAKLQKAQQQIDKYVANTWRAQPGIDLSIGTSTLAGSFDLHTRYVDYFVNYYCVGHGIVKYEYTWRFVPEQALEDLGSVILIGGTAAVFCLSGGTVQIPLPA